MNALTREKRTVLRQRRQRDRLTAPQMAWGRFVRRMVARPDTYDVLAVYNRRIRRYRRIKDGLQ